MAALDITEDEIRQRLQITETELSDDFVANALSAADAWCSVVLNNNSKEASDFETYELALLKTAKLDYAALHVIQDGMVEGYAVLGIKADGVKAKDKVDLCDKIEKQIRGKCDLLSLELKTIHITSAGEDDYMPDGEDNTNIDLAESSSDDPFSVWS